MADPTTPRRAAAARPSDAECAVTALADASAATVTTYSRDPAARHRQTVTRLQSEGGRFVFWLDARSWAVSNLCARPVAQLSVADPRSRSAVVLLRGGVRRVSGAREGRLPFVLDVTSVRLLETRRPGAEVLLELDDFRAAEPDPLRSEAATVLAHLRDAHADDLLHCVRSQGRGDAAWVEPARLDRYGLELLVVSPEAVSELRLPFPHPLTALDELGPGLRSALTCRCRPAPSQPGAGS